MAKPAKDLSLRATFASYAVALREEPKLRFYFVWTLVEDVGTAVAQWAGAAFNNDVVTTPGAEAAVAIPMLWANIIANLFGGVVADWPGKNPEALARWRYKVTVWRNLFHIVSLSMFVVTLASGKGSLVAKIAFSTVGHFITTLTQATRTAYFVDLLHKEELQRNPDGKPAFDEAGLPKEYKVHLLTAHQLLHMSGKLASFFGVLLGGWLLDLVAGRYWMLYAAHSFTYAAFAVGVAVTCHPYVPWRQFSFRLLFREKGFRHIDDEALSRVARGKPSLLLQTLLASWDRLTGNFRSLYRFFMSPANYALSALLGLEWVLKLSNGMFNTRLLVTHVLGQDLEFFRRIELTKNITNFAVSFLVVGLRARTRVLGWIVVGFVLLEGLMRTAGGLFGERVAAAFEAAGTKHYHHHGGAALYATVVALVVAGASAVIVGALTSLAHQSCSSSALRGQIIAGVLLIDTIAQMLSQLLYPPLAAVLGQPQLLAWAGVIQIVVVGLMLLLPKRGPAGFAILVPQ